MNNVPQNTAGQISRKVPPIRAAQIDTEKDPLVALNTELADSARRYIKSAAAISGETMGEWLVSFLCAHCDYAPPYLLKSEQQTTAKAS